MRNALLLFGLGLGIITACDKVEPPVYGCTDAQACNYNEAAQLDDASCNYTDCEIIGCMDTEASNYNPVANTPCEDCCTYNTADCFADPTTIERKVLVEDFTGHTCNNCPDAAEELAAIIDANNHRVIGIGIHAGFFSSPKPVSVGEFTTDFRTEDGNTIHDHFQPQAYPIGLVNRVGYTTASPADALKPFSEWSAAVSTELQASAQVGICLQEAGNNIQVDVLGLAELNEDYSLVLCVTESHIIDWQTVGTGNISDYEHNHVLRGMLNGAWGESIGTITKDEITSYSFPLSLESNWVKENCNVVAYIYNTSTKYIVQAEEIHL
jgi:hypothetical protein